MVKQTPFTDSVGWHEPQQQNTGRTTRWRNLANAVVGAIGNDDVAQRIHTHTNWPVESSLQRIGAINEPLIAITSGYRRHH